jgi:hypothetical protein
VLHPNSVCFVLVFGLFLLALKEEWMAFSWIICVYGRKKEFVA